jgi:hypothetical protein
VPLKASFNKQETNKVLTKEVTTRSVEVTGYRLDDRDSVNGMDRDVPFATTLTTVLGPIKPSVQCVVGPLSPRIKRLYRKTDKPSPSTAKG